MTRLGAFWIFAIVGCAGCAANDGIPDTLIPDFYTGQTRPASPTLEGCVWVVDLRSRETFHNYVMPSEAMLAWLKDGVEAKLGVAAVPRAEPPADDVYVGVYKAYMSHLATSISGVVVLQVGDGVNTHTARGRVTRTNWWGTDAEYSRLLNDALDDAFLNVANIEARSKDCLLDQ